MTYYTNLYIYYFSGTGNAYSAAKWIKENGEKEGLNVYIQTIEKLENFKLKPPEGKTLFAFTYPTHGFAAPWLMLKFLWNFPRISNSDVLFVNTQAGSKIWKFYIPGMSGLAQWISIFIFWFKGYSVKGSLPLDMPHSWISFSPPNLRLFCNQMVERCHRIVNKMCDKIFTGKRYYRYTVWTHLWFDIAVSWITPLYLFCGRFFLAKTLFPSYNCNGCKICEIHCPVGAIEIRNGMPYWKYTCESCMRCMNICPQMAIQSWVTRIMLFFYLLTVAVIQLTNWNEYFIFLIVSILFFPIYWIFIKILHIKIINILFTYTSFTKLWNRYITPGVELSDFKRRNEKNRE
ncbi:MAG: hypothetical protein HY738_09840 [Bacteroidia bacterium]|nr:hypothetical protein [Bacteroidia bacterium]